MKQSGFSLFELSIVLIVIALLTGGVLVGKGMLRQSEVRSVIQQYEAIHAGAWTFKNKYNAIPGDLRDATAYWGRLNGNADCVTNATAAIKAPGTCDGNGNGLVETAPAADASGEMFQFWRQMTLAGVLEGNYTGLAGPAGYWNSLLGQNVPASKMPGAGWSVRFLGDFAGNSTSYAMDYGTVYDFGKESGITSTANPALTPAEAETIDAKIDDGKPASGTVIAFFWDNLCAAADDGGSSNTDLVASYRVNDPSTYCSLMFRHQF